MKFLSKVNYQTRKHLGSTGRVVATASATAAVASLAATKFELEFLESPYAVAGVGIVTALVAEGVFAFFGADAGQQLGETVDIAVNICKLKDEEYCELMKLVKESVSEEEAAKIDTALTALRAGNALVVAA